MRESGYAGVVGQYCLPIRIYIARFRTVVDSVLTHEMSMGTGYVDTGYGYGYGLIRRVQVASAMRLPIENLLLDALHHHPYVRLLATRVPGPFPEVSTLPNRLTVPTESHPHVQTKIDWGPRGPAQKPTARLLC